ncbi:MAG TPA: RNA polymerase factor sigma-54 [Patescibacteria group bacterium]|nr:RNA polymerase factor sigma-54 [Patescibacteria group bacterium]
MMQMDYSLKLETSQKLIMTPQLRQAIAILQLSSLELASMVETELLENPVLEVSGEEVQQQETSDAGEAEATAKAVETSADPLQEPEKDRDDRYAEWADYFDGGSAAVKSPRNTDNRCLGELYCERVVSLQEHLEAQLHFSALDPLRQRIGEYLIGCVDDNGYLSCSLAEAATALGNSEYLLEEVLQMIQTFDPLGVGARDLKECLYIQIRQMRQERPEFETDLVRAIIDGYLGLVAEGRYKQVADQLGSTPQAVQRAVDLIRTLDPKPGRSFGGSSQLAYIVPDITVERVNSGYQILINDTNVPQLHINPYYRQVIRDVDSEARKFVEGRINSAVWLIKSIDQRRRTLYNVMEAIVELQRDFFDRGPQGLRPLTMKKIADRVGVHESTVSRAVANKYAATPHGLRSLHSFFSACIQGRGGEDVAAVTVKNALKELITAEDAIAPLSDQALTDILNRQGMAVSRRTVAKYREDLGIASSSRRRRY